MYNLKVGSVRTGGDSGEEQTRDETNETDERDERDETDGGQKRRERTKGNKGLSFSSHLLFSSLFSSPHCLLFCISFFPLLCIP